MHPSHLTAFVDGFLTIGIPMQAKGATTREILIAMSERNVGSVGARRRRDRSTAVFCPDTR